jgi:hypothetical protein
MLANPRLAELATSRIGDAWTRDHSQFRALEPLEGAVPEDVLRDFNQVVANLQLAYATASAPDAGEPLGNFSVPRTRARK